MKTFIYFVVAFSLAIGYLVWLDSGCELSGVMTWEGKVCVESL